MESESQTIIDMAEYEGKTVILSFEIDDRGIESVLSISDIWVDGVNITKGFKDGSAR